MTVSQQPETGQGDSNPMSEGDERRPRVLVGSCFVLWLTCCVAFLVTVDWVWLVAGLGWQAATLCATKLSEGNR